jgi:hypothetical protein
VALSATGGKADKAHRVSRCRGESEHAISGPANQDRYRPLGLDEPGCRTWQAQECVVDGFAIQQAPEHGHDALELPDALGI